MAEHVLGAPVQAEAAEKGYLSPSIAAGFPAPLRWDTAATSKEGAAQGLHDHPWVLRMCATPDSPPC